MRRSPVGVTLVLGAVLLAASAAGAEPSHRARPSAAELGLRPTTMYVRVPVPDEARPARRVMYANAAKNVIFLNRNGGSYTPGWVDDAVGNVSSIVQYDVAMQPYPYGDSSWNQVLTCMRGLYADFDVEVTDVDPGDAPHTEVVVSGHPNDIGLPNGVGGVAPMACEAISSAVSFAFPETYGDDPTGICEAAGQESAYAFGLDHEILCSDIMTYGYCGAKDFKSEDSDCGEYEPRPCACGGDTQNSHEYLLDVLGPAAPAGPPPEVTIVTPEDGETVGPGFGVDVEITAEAPILRVELHVDGQLVGSRFAEPWSLEANGDIADGPHDLEARVDDAARKARRPCTSTCRPTQGRRRPRPAEPRVLGGRGRRRLGSRPRAPRPGPRPRPAPPPLSLADLQPEVVDHGCALGVVELDHELHLRDLQGALDGWRQPELRHGGADVIGQRHPERRPLVLRRLPDDRLVVEGPRVLEVAQDAGRRRALVVDREVHDAGFAPTTTHPVGPRWATPARR